MTGFFKWLRNGSRLADDEIAPGDFDPYVAQLVRQRALLWARTAAPRLN